MAPPALLAIVVAATLLAGCGSNGSGANLADSGIDGHVHLGPQCPVEIAGQPCADKPAAGAKITVTKQVSGDSPASGEVVARTTTDADGNYRLVVEPGNYGVTADAGMSCELIDVRVGTGPYSKVDIACDTGIR